MKMHAQEPSDASARGRAHGVAQARSAAVPATLSSAENPAAEPRARIVAQREMIAELFGPALQQRPAQMKAGLASPAQRAPASAVPTNRTGLPDGLKAGIESLSGMSLNHVKVHYNSSQPAQLNALAYAQGSDIHVAPGQERHLPHEAWHVVQQAQGRVRPTIQMKDGMPVNDDPALEQEADVMGARALSAGIVQGRWDYQAGGLAASTSVVQAKPVVQLYDWFKSTPLATIWSFLSGPSYEGAKDLVDPRRSRLNPLNLVEGLRNYGEETAGGNYHSSSKHGAHNTVGNTGARLNAPSTMDNHYTGATVNAAATSSRFNSEAWESFSWRRAKELFQADIGVPVNWVAGPFPAATRSSWNVCLNHAGSDVGISQGGIAAAIVSVSGVRVAVNYRPAAAGGGGVDAYNGQMFPEAPVAPPPGVVRPGHPAGAAMNGTIQAIPYSFLGYFGI